MPSPAVLLAAALLAPAVPQDGALLGDAGPPAGTQVPLVLAGEGTLDLDEDVHYFRGNTPGDPDGGLPRGRHELAGVTFQLGPTFAPLAGRGDPLRAEAVTMDVGRAATAFYFLHGTGYSADEGTPVAAVDVTYEDGTETRLPIEYGEAVADWWVPEAGQGGAKLVPAWRGTNGPAAKAKRAVGFYAWGVTNPKPDVPVESVTYRTLWRGDVIPVLIAATVTSPDGADPPAVPEPAPGVPGGGESEGVEKAIAGLEGAGVIVNRNAAGEAVAVTLGGIERQGVSGELFELPHLTHVTVWNAGDQTARNIAAVKTVEAVGFKNATVGRAAVRALAGLPKLRRLHLGGTSGLGAESALRPLAGVTALRHLDLHGTDAVDAALVPLAGMKGLKVLDVSGTNVSPRAVSALRRVRPDLDVRY